MYSGGRLASHLGLVHCSESKAEFGQFKPLTLSVIVGGGSLQVRALDRIPPPQVTEQAAQGPHCAHYQVERVMCYKHDIEVDGLDNCYDCRAEVYVFEEYIKISDKLKKFSNNEIEIFETVKEYIEDSNSFLNAKSKIIRITKDGEHYDLQFTDVKYGKTFEEICNPSTRTFKKRKTYLDQWKPKRLEHGIFEEKKQNNPNRNYASQ